MKNLFAIVIAFSLVFCIATSKAVAADPGDVKAADGVRFHKKMDVPHKSSGLNLSGEQKEKAKDLRNRFRADTRDLRYDLEMKRLEMRKLFTDPNASEAAIVAKQREIGTLFQKLFEKRAQMKIEWRKILTAEQISNLDQTPWGQGHGHMKGRHMGQHMRPDMGHGSHGGPACPVWDGNH
ncbi:MAG: Spy/CpxP family protein refolding chaperone [Syntrophobacterales bacterium]|nr:Spy/CpxP family protein refolding chaperone [Syntrophobacterales bacterium]